MAIKRTLPHAVQKAPPAYSAAERKYEGHLHNGTGKKPQTSFSQVLSGEQKKHAQKEAAEETFAPKPELSVPIDPRSLVVIMREAQDELQRAGAHKGSAPSPAPSQHRHRIIPDSEYGLGGKKSEHVQRLLLVQKAKLDEGQRVIRQFSEEMRRQLKIALELKSQAWHAKRLLSGGDVAGAAQCIDDMDQTATKLSKTVEKARLGKLDVLAAETSIREKEPESVAARGARAQERERATALFCARIGHSLNQPLQSILSSIDLLKIQEKNLHNTCACLNTIEKSIQIFEERAAKIRGVKEVREAPYAENTKMLRVD